MRKTDIDKNFEVWRQTQAEENLTEEDALRLAFAAGCKFVEKKKFKPYRLRTGQWVVSVEATTLKDAKAIATARLNQRAKKLKVTPPSGGWSLQVVR
jgi:hypothetical protein